MMNLWNSNVIFDSKPTNKELVQVIVMTGHFRTPTFSLPMWERNSNLLRSSFYIFSIQVTNVGAKKQT